MKVGELIKKLAEYPSDLPVVLFYESGIRANLDLIWLGTDDYPKKNTSVLVLADECEASFVPERDVFGGFYF